MKFELIGTRNYYSGKEKELWESFGAVFRDKSTATGGYCIEVWGLVTINGLFDLEELQKTFENEVLIVDFSCRSIEIYNDYRE